MARHDSWDGELAGGLIAMALVLTILTVVFTTKLLVATGREIGRVYRDNASDAGTARILWYALGALCGLLLICGMVAVVAPAATAASLFVAVWGFLVFILAIEVVDWRANQAYGPHGKVGDLESYLGGLESAKAEPVVGSSAKQATSAAQELAA